MQIYSTEDTAGARKKLPKPLSIFLDSEELSKIYSEIRVESNLNLRQIAALIEVVTFTLVGLEPQPAFLKNLREALPELSDQEIEKLLTQINEHIFKEANRRLITKPDMDAASEGL